MVKPLTRGVEIEAIRAELPAALALLGYLFLVIASTVVAKAVRDSLFITRFSAWQLPRSGRPYF